jgi:hypothetical protein
MRLQDLQNTVDALAGRMQALEALMEATHSLVLTMSQSYYWTPEWQAKEERADEDDILGRSKQYESVDELIRELNE